MLISRRDKQRKARLKTRRVVGTPFAEEGYDSETGHANQQPRTAHLFQMHPLGSVDAGSDRSKCPQGVCRASPESVLYHEGKLREYSDIEGLLPLLVRTWSQTEALC